MKLISNLILFLSEEKFPGNVIHVCDLDLKFIHIISGSILKNTLNMNEKGISDYFNVIYKDKYKIFNSNNFKYC